MTRPESLGAQLVSKDAIDVRVAELAAEISRDYEGESPLLIGILRGAIIFLADLVRSLTVPSEIDFMAVSSYGSATTSSGVVRILKDLDRDVTGRHILLVEDIVDTGLTLNYLLKNLTARNPKSIEVCALLIKESKQKVRVPIRYVGFHIPDRFVVGYGLDYDERFRYLSCIHEIEEQHIKR